MPNTAYVLSDVHGHLPCLLTALEMIDIDSDEGASLILLGDYIDRGAQSAEVLYTIKAVADQWPNRVIALLGNHEVDFLDWMSGNDEDVFWPLQDLGFVTIGSLLTTDQMQRILGNRVELPTDVDGLTMINRAVKDAIKMNHPALLAWLNRLPLYYETSEQIFVHAGVNEQAGENWRSQTPDLTFTHKFPASVGTFSKTIIAGHIGTSSMHPDGSHGVFFDGASHYYIDGSIERTDTLNILKYTAATSHYEYLTATVQTQHQASAGMDDSLSRFPTEIMSRMEITGVDAALGDGPRKVSNRPAQNQLGTQA
ncbi:metallophosphoesterase [Arthrobacter alpinus]|uniref:metallophosphoesterase n=1 Tax=Arthrobacter alpinus TaxID=656366 RepID=UPI0007851E7A|nr:metallophosphoesterase [Arthrobacter alpinus]